MEEFIILGTFVVIGEHFKGLCDVMKPLFSCLAVLLVLIRMPLGCEFLEGTLDFEEGGALGNP